MVERFADKQIEVLEQICNDNFKSNSVSDYGIEISEKGFIQMIERFQMFGWLKISHTMPLDLSGEEPGCDGKTLIYYEIINKKGLSEFLLKLKKEYPKHQTPLIQEKSIELIARDIGEFDTGVELVKFLQKCGVEKELIIYPNTKWRMIYDVLVYLSYSARNKDRDLLYSIITDSIHPLMHNGDWDKSKQICEKFNQYLIYDRFEISYSTDNRKYKISYEPTSEEEDEVDEKMAEEIGEQQVVAERDFFQKSENVESVSVVRKAYQTLINIVETFCQNPSEPTNELNDAYLKIKEIVRKTSWELNTIGKDSYDISGTFSNIFIPFINLFTAESQFKGQSLSWDELRPKMHYTYGHIDEVFRKANGSDILAEPDIQKTLNDVSLLISETKNKNESLKEPGGTKKIIDTLDDTIIRGFQNMFSNPTKEPTNQSVQKIEIVNKVLNTRVQKDDISSKVGRFPEKLKAGIQWKNIIISFIDERNVIIHVGGKEYPTDYEKMEFAKGANAQTPTATWKFLEVLAKHNGELSPDDPDAKSTFKKQKELLTKALQAYFRKEEDPFFPYESSPEKRQRSYKTRFGVFYRQEKKNDPFADLESVMNEEMSST